MLKNKILTIILILILCFISLLSPVFASERIASYGEPFDVEGESAILIDSATGKILYEKNIHEKLYPASVTKIMVLLLTMEDLDNNKITLEDEVVISENAANMGGSQVYLEEGETQKVRDLIRAIALRSGNDCAVAMGEYLAGSEEAFVQKMNQKAKEIGMKNTNFMNPTGLHHEEHYTTAYDISLMSKELLKHKRIHDWLTIWMSELKVGKEKDSVQQMVNTNRLVYDHKGLVNGIKTGYTSKAGYCLASSATKGSFTLISVILNSPSTKIRNRDTMKLLNHGFANYDSIPVVRKGELVKTVKISKGKLEDVDVVAKEDISLLLKKGQSGNIDKEIILPEKLDAPLEKDYKVGEVIYKINGEEKARVDLITKEEVSKASLIDMLGKILGKFIGK